MLENDEKHEENDVVMGDEITPQDLEIDTNGEESSFKEKLKVLREKLSVCEEEKRKHLEELQRTRADFLNSKRRLDEQLIRDRERATDKIIFELLSLADSFDIAMVDKELWKTIDERWRIGVEAIHAKLLSILKSNNVTPIDPVGLPFNPEEHEAVSDVLVTDDAQIDVIVAVLQKGFKRNETILRPARVTIGTKAH